MFSRRHYDASIIGVLLRTLRKRIAKIPRCDFAGDSRHYTGADVQQNRAQCHITRLASRLADYRQKVLRVYIYRAGS